MKRLHLTKLRMTVTSVVLLCGAVTVLSIKLWDTRNNKGPGGDLPDQGRETTTWPVRLFVYPISAFPGTPAPCCTYSPMSGVLSYIDEHPHLSWVVTNPEEATHFLLPILGACKWGEAGDSAATTYISTALDIVAARWPYLAAHGGRDHILDVTWPDNDRCAQRFSAAAGNLRPRLLPFIGLSVNGDSRPGNAGCELQGQDVLMPSNCHSESIDGLSPEAKVLAFGPDQSHRNITGVFRGSPHDRRWTIRPDMMDALVGVPGFIVSAGHVESSQYEWELYHTVFALCPSAYEQWTTRLFAVIAYGAIPVVVSDHLRVPFDEVIGASGTLVIIRWHELASLADILQSMPKEEITRRQRALPALAAAWSYRQDAVEHMVRELAARRVREEIMNGTHLKE